MASRAERKAKLDAMSEDKFYKFVAGAEVRRFFTRGIFQDRLLTAQHNRDVGTKLLLDAADGEDGTAIDNLLGLPTNVELTRQREERSVRANWMSAMAAMLALLISIAALTKGELWNFPTRSDPIPAQGKAAP